VGRKGGRVALVKEKAEVRLVQEGKKVIEERIRLVKEEKKVG